LPSAKTGAGRRREAAPEAASLYPSSSEEKKRKLDAFVSAETAQELSETLEYERFDDYVDRETRHELPLALQAPTRSELNVILPGRTRSHGW
jgi:predicted nucleic acid-binding protein